MYIYIYNKYYNCCYYDKYTTNNTNSNKLAQALNVPFIAFAYFTQVETGLTNMAATRLYEYVYIYIYI